MKKICSFILCALVALSAFSQSSFKWPEGKRVAISLTFDDARSSQVDRGTALLDQYGVKATFFVNPASMTPKLEGWKKAKAAGHEIGNHSQNHPCTGNFAWSRSKALENYTLDQMQSELLDANKNIEAMLGVKAEVFAYPCGQTFVGRGKETKSYVPLVADIFVLGRLWLSEGANDPAFCDFAQLTGVEMDGKDFEQILPIIEEARKNQSWLVLAGHEMGDSGSQTTRLAMLKKLIEYAQNPANGIWIAPAGIVGKYVLASRKLVTSDQRPVSSDH